MRKRKRLRLEAEERKADWKHNRELAIWFGPKFMAWEKEFTDRFTFNMRAALRATLGRGEPPIENDVVPWKPYDSD